MGRQMKRNLFLLLLVLLALFWQQKMFAREGADAPLKKYILNCTDSYKGYYYYVSWPEIMIQNQDARVHTEYRFADGNGGFIEGKLINQEKIYFHTEFQGSKNVLHVWMEDDAGIRYGEQTLEFYLDTEKPRTWIQGADDYTITGECVEIACFAEDNYELDVLEASIVWKDVKGKESKISGGEWTQSEGKQIFKQTLKQEGMYCVEVRAVDKAGQVSQTKVQIIIDRSGPVITQIDDIHKKYIKEFVLEYPVSQFIKDATSYTYEILVDGQLYVCGNKITEEGPHKLTIRAEDSAGNQAEAEAEFVIDHTPPEIIITGIEENVTYKEKAEFQIQLKNQDDTIEKIMVNGEPEQIRQNQEILTYSLCESGEWEVCVTAKDKTGNRAEKSVLFRIISEEDDQKHLALTILIVILIIIGCATVGEIVITIKREDAG